MWYQPDVRPRLFVNILRLQNVDLNHITSYTNLIQKFESDPEKYKWLINNLVVESQSFRNGFGNKYRLTSNEINDLTSGCLLKLINQIRNREAQEMVIENIQGYFAGIFKNEVVDYLKEKSKAGFKFVSLGDMSNFETDTPSNSHQVLERKISSLIKIVEKLRPKDQVIVFMRYYGNFSLEEIGNVLKISNHSVKTTLHRALQKMRVLVMKELEKSDKGNQPTQVAESV